MRRLIGLGVVLVACSGASQDADETSDAPEISSDWVRVRASCGYGFHAPPELTVQDVQGIDSCVDAWTSTTCQFNGDYGAFSSDLSEYADFPSYQQMQWSIDGRNAKVITAFSSGAPIAAVHFPEADPDNKGIRLTLWTECADEPGQRDALAAFGSITFDP